MADDYFRTKRYQEINQDIRDYIIAHQNKITDFNEGGALSSQIEAFSGELEEYYSRTKLGFIRFLLKLPYAIFGFSRGLGTRSAGTVNFSTATGEPAEGDVSIPEGTLVATGAGIQFETTEEGTIASGSENSGTVIARAVEVGTDGNVSAGSIETILSVIPQVEEVDNTLPFVGGVNEETEPQFKKRFTEYVNGLGRSNAAGIRYGATTVEGIRSVGIVEHFPPKGNLYNLTLYIDDGSGTASSEKVAEVEERIDGDGTQDNPGFRPAGINIEYLIPSLVTIDVDISATAEQNSDPATTEYNVQTAVTQYINSLVIGQDFILHDLTRAIIGVFGVKNFTYTSPTADVVINEDQVARVGTITVGFS